MLPRLSVEESRQFIAKHCGTGQVIPSWAKPARDEDMVNWFRVRANQANILWSQSKTPTEVMAATGLTESTTRKHLDLYRKRSNDPAIHHPEEKRRQIQAVLKGKTGLTIFEVFSGHPHEFGGCTLAFSEFGSVFPNYYDEKASAEIRRQTDAALVVYKALAAKKKFDVGDLDAYGVLGGELILMGFISLINDNGYLFLTVSSPGNSRGGRNVIGRYECTFGTPWPTQEDIVKFVQLHARRSLAQAELACKVETWGGIWRFVFQIKRAGAAGLYGKGKSNGTVGQVMKPRVPKLSVRQTAHDALYGKDNK